MKTKAPTTTSDKTPSKANSVSRITKAVEYMRAEVKKASGLKKLEYGARAQIVAAAAKKFGLAVPTCSTQYQKQVRV